MDDDKNTFQTKRINISGIVQGVGFRPFVFQCAQKYGICGMVRNIGGAVEIIAQSNRRAMGAFLTQLQNERAGSWEIMKMEAVDIPAAKYHSFHIAQSMDCEENANISPDIAICPKCTEELCYADDRRYQNAFISCTACGPRYSIIELLPYDRQNTSMRDFDMCTACKSEYTSPKDRRFHAQTISCHDCGPYLKMQSSENLVKMQALEKAVCLLKSGGIVAVKGIGGYLFACSPFQEDTIEKLRKLKGRDEKPFAVMFASVHAICKYCDVSKEEEAILRSKASPIVLLKIKENSDISYAVAKGSIYCGAFLPYTPLQVLLMKVCGPLIMTSANISDNPIIKDDREMMAIQSPHLDGILWNDRRIVRFVDDSVVKMVRHRPQLIRRSRGYVPYPILLPNVHKNLQIFAAGSDLKAAFCLYKNHQAVLSAHLGDLEGSATNALYRDTLQDALRLFKIKPDIAICDMHPNYHSARFAKTLNIPIIDVQHHHAHIASVMAEHHLEQRVIGVAFDGSGYGTDGNVWGGEFLICDGPNFVRAAHLAYTPMLGGDTSVKDAKKTATCFLLHHQLEQYVCDDRKEIIKAALRERINTIQSSSMGRLFDAVCAILQLGDANSYEGQCGANVEKEAVLCMKSGIKPAELTFGLIEQERSICIDLRSVLDKLCQLKECVSVGAIALGFHDAVAQMILDVCKIIRKRQNIEIVALSGGVFQNTVLLEKTLDLLEECDFEVFYNMSVPPNDGGLSLGQAYIGLMR